MNNISEYDALLQGKLLKLQDILALTEINTIDPDDTDSYVNYVNYIDDKTRIFEEILEIDKKLKNASQGETKSSKSLKLEKDIQAICQKIYELDEINLEKAASFLENLKGELVSVKKQKRVNSYGNYLSLSAGGSFDTSK